MLRIAPKPCVAQFAISSCHVYLASPRDIRAPFLAFRQTYPPLPYTRENLFPTLSPSFYHVLVSARTTPPRTELLPSVPSSKTKIIKPLVGLYPAPKRARLISGKPLAALGNH